MKLHSIETGFFKLDGGAMFGVVPKSIWNRTNPADDNNLCTWAMRCLLIEDENRLILIDTGIGNKQDAKFFSHYYLHGDYSLEKSINEKGYGLNDITDVILTHLHFDHVGGAVTKDHDGYLSPTFKNATYWSNEVHWEWALNPNPREKASFLKENILPLKEHHQLQFIPNIDFTTFTENIKIRFANGHTKAMMLPLINYNNHTLLYMADLLPSVGHIPLPYVMAYDMFPLITLQEKQQILSEVCEKKYVMILEHDPKIECCTLKQTEKGIMFEEAMRIADL